MFENMSIETLQSYWYIIVSLLGSVLVFLMFVQGGQTLIYTIGKNEEERKIMRKREEEILEKFNYKRS